MSNINKNSNNFNEEVIEKAKNSRFAKYDSEVVEHIESELTEGKIKKHLDKPEDIEKFGTLPFSDYIGDSFTNTPQPERAQLEEDLYKQLDDLRDKNGDLDPENPIIWELQDEIEANKLSFLAEDTAYFSLYGRNKDTLGPETMVLFKDK